MFKVLLATWLVISSAFAVDMYLTVKHASVMRHVELNPIGAKIISTDGGVPLFVGLKMGGLGGAMLLIFALWQHVCLRRAVVASCSAVAFLHVCQLAYMFEDSEFARACVAEKALVERQREHCRRERECPRTEAVCHQIPPLPTPEADPMHTPPARSREVLVEAARALSVFN